MAGVTTNYSFNYPTSTDLVKDGATAIQTLATNVDTTLFTALGGAYPGLRLIKKQTVGSAVASVTVTGAFSATYENYKILYVGGTTSTPIGINGGLSGSATGYYNSLIYCSFANTSVLASNNNNGTAWTFFGYGTADNNAVNVDILSPFAAKKTAFSCPQMQVATGGASGFNSGFHNSATSYTDFFLTPASGTLTGGTIYVYGYGAS